MRRAFLVLALVLILVMSFAGTALAGPPDHASDGGGVGNGETPAPAPHGDMVVPGHCWGHHHVSPGAPNPGGQAGGVQAWWNPQANQCVIPQ